VGAFAAARLLRALSIPWSLGPVGTGGRAGSVDRVQRVIREAAANTAQLVLHVYAESA
jgi:hypothetical protein